MTQLPVIIDTDPGLDDALALIIALRSAELNVVGITTVAGNIGLSTTTRNAGRMLALLGRPDVPIVSGAAEPLRRPHLDAAEIHGGDGIGGVALPEPQAEPAGRDAVGYLREELERRPAGTLRIMALGPLTNIAHLILEHPETAARAESIVAMGGAVRDRGNVTAAAEFNVWADPEAYDVVLRSGLPFLMIPLDVTRKVLATPDWSGRLDAIGGPLATVAAQMIRAYLANIEAMRTAKGFPEAERKAAGFPLHDPCVMLHALRPDLFTIERLPLRIVCDRSEADGATVIDPTSEFFASVTTGVASEDALALAFERLSRS